MDFISAYADAPPLSQSSGDMRGVKLVGVEEERDIRADDSECEVSTVDSFQGRDMDVVILSSVKNVDGGLVSSRRLSILITFAVHLSASFFLLCSPASMNMN